jgi:predicted deacylase
MHVAGASTHSVEIPFIAFNGAESGPTLTVLGGVHGVECTPVEGILRLSDRIDLPHLRGKLMLLPVVNVEAFHARTPYENQLDHLNQNKVWPGDPEGSITKRIAHTVWTEVISKSDYIVDAHSADLGEDATRGIFIYNTDKPELTRRMTEMAQCFDVDYIEGTTTSGNTGECVSRLSVPAVMTESGAPYPIRDRDVEWLVDGVTNLMRHLKMLPGEAVIRKVPVNPPSTRLWSKVGGAWRRKVEAGQKVREGEPLGVVCSLTGEKLQTILAPYNGTITFLRTHYSVNEGDTLLWITRV